MSEQQQDMERCARCNTQLMKAWAASFRLRLEPKVGDTPGQFMYTSACPVFSIHPSDRFLCAACASAWVEIHHRDAVVRAMRQFMQPEPPAESRPKEPQPLEQLALFQHLVEAVVALEEREWGTRNAAENTYCQDCASKDQRWKDQREHAPACAYMALISRLKAHVIRIGRNLPDFESVVADYLKKVGWPT